MDCAGSVDLRFNVDLLGIGQSWGHRLERHSCLSMQSCVIILVSSDRKLANCMLRSASYFHCTIVRDTRPSVKMI